MLIIQELKKTAYIKKEKIISKYQSGPPWMMYQADFPTRHIHDEFQWRKKSILIMETPISTPVNEIFRISIQNDAK